jgi:tetratricopeptide (TPR) repeat protein
MPVIDRLFSAAAAHRAAGNGSRAATLCRRVLRKNPAHASALHLMGLLAADSGQNEIAAALIAQTIELQGPLPDSCINLGIVLARMKQHDPAMACYRQALALDPQSARAAIALGRVLAETGRPSDAIEVFHRATPDPEAHFEIGRLLWIRGDAAGALESFEQAIAVDGKFAEAWHNAAVALKALGLTGRAAECCRRAIHIRPGYAAAYATLGTCVHATDAAEAERCYRSALAAGDDNASVHYNLALAIHDQDRLDDAAAEYQRVLESETLHPEALNNLGNVLVSVGRPEDAIRHYAQSTHPDAAFNLGCTRLLLGNFDRGWGGYDRRPSKCARSFIEPEWDGSPLGGRRILLWAEQGLGDTIQFARYIHHVVALGGEVVLECQPQLAGLFGRLPIVQLIAPGVELPKFDCHAPLMSLARLFGIAADVPYVQADGAMTIGGVDQNVGLAWAGNPAHRNDRNRSMSVADMQPLVAAKGCRFFSLQKDRAAPEWMEPLPLGDFQETARAIAALDLVISVDTAVAHLAGAMAKPVWTLLPFAPDWRWMLHRDDSPWYPTMRLFRQAERGNWQNVIDSVRQELSAKRL